MATNRTTIEAAIDDVWAVLADARSYEQWLVGCKKIRAADDGWPQPGTRFYHRVGVGPLEVADSTLSVEADAPRRLVLEARARPVGTACVTFELAPAEDGVGCVVTMHEKPLRGPAKRFDNPLLDALVAIRNKASLRRLRQYVVGNSGNGDSGGGDSTGSDDISGAEQPQPATGDPR
jgi:uncharacterized protein YndB with AHSA1/START domain